MAFHSIKNEILGLGEKAISKSGLIIAVWMQLVQLRSLIFFWCIHRIPSCIEDWVKFVEYVFVFTPCIRPVLCP